MLSSNCLTNCIKVVWIWSFWDRLEEFQDTRGAYWYCAGGVRVKGVGRRGDGLLGVEGLEGRAKLVQEKLGVLLCSLTGHLPFLLLTGNWCGVLLLSLLSGA